jgi:DNA-binding CsgD family transcriptional regulator
MAQSDTLSSREREVANLLLEGKSNKLIASSLGISESTVEFHLKNIYTKFQVASRMELVIKLGQSTVAGKGEIAENRDWLNLRNWAASLREVISTFSKELEMTRAINSNPDNEASPLTFYESIRVCLAKYAEFNGRASRSEFWWFALFVLLVASALTYLSETLGSVFLIVILLPLLAAGTRRLRDSDKSPWWQLFLLVPVGGLVILGFLWALPPVRSLPDEALPV